MPRQARIPVARRRRRGRGAIVTTTAASEARSSSMARRWATATAVPAYAKSRASGYVDDCLVAYRGHRIPGRRGPDMAGAQAKPRIDAQPCRRQEVVRQELRQLPRRGSEGYETRTTVSARHLRILSPRRCRIPTCSQEWRPRSSLAVWRHETVTRCQPGRCGPYHRLRSLAATSCRHRLRCARSPHRRNQRNLLAWPKRWPSLDAVLT